MSKPNPELEKIGTLKVPVSQWKLGQTLLWIRSEGWKDGIACPLDGKIFPEGNASTLLKNQLNLVGQQGQAEPEVFYLFREIQMGSSDDNEILVVFDRMRVVSPKVENVLQKDQREVQDLAEEARKILQEDHDVIINQDYLKEVLLTDSQYADVTDARELVDKLLTKRT